jgi:hypothetical protein
LRRGVAGLLYALPASAHAQPLSVWHLAGALSPIAVLALCAVVGWLAGSLRTGALHAALVAAWVVLFVLASYFVENDYLIWTPLALYVLHAALLVVLTVVHAAMRIGRRRQSGS